MLKRIICFVISIMMFSSSVLAYDVVDLPNSMTFSDAIGVFNSQDIASATVADIDKNIYKTLSRDEIDKFFDIAKDVTVWRKINPTPFRGACVNFTTTAGNSISYYFNSGIQIGRYGDDNYVCYMPARDNSQELSYVFTDLYDADSGVYGGAQWNVVINKDFLKLPNHEWAKETIKEAAKKSLVPYEFTNKYEKNISREEMAILIANFITVAGNYANIGAYMKATGTVYLTNSFRDCVDRDEAIDCLYALGIISGVDGVNFNPDGMVTRQEAAAFMTRAAELYMYVGTNYKTKTADWNKVAPWADFYIKWCIDKGLLLLDDSQKIYPTDYMTVEQAVTVLSRLYDIATYWES